MTPQTAENRQKNIIDERIKPDAKLSAHTNKELQDPNFSNNPIIRTGLSYINDKSNAIVDRIVIALLMAYGLRISEVLNIRYNDITPQGTILIHGSKGSENRFISGMQFSKYIVSHALSFTTHLRYRNRWYYYRLFKRIGIYKKMTGNTNFSVTHAFRYEFIKQLQGMTKDINETGKIIGHKNTNNTKRYDQKTKK